MIPPSIAFYAAQAWVRVLAVFVIALALVAGGYRLGAKVTRADWEAERAEQQKERADAEAAARTEERRRADESRRVLDQLVQREVVSRDRAARAERAAVGLRDEIARLNARPAPEDPRAAGFAHEARVARELLGSCSARYTGLAAEADGLRDQVTGLQDWVTKVAGPQAK